MTWDVLVSRPRGVTAVSTGLATEQEAVRVARTLVEDVARAEIEDALRDLAGHHPEIPLPSLESVLPEIVPDRRAIGDGSGNVAVLLLTPGSYRTRDDDEPMIAFKAWDVREYWVVPSQYTERVVERVRVDDLARLHRMAEQGAFDG